MSENQNDENINKDEQTPENTEISEPEIDSIKKLKDEIADFKDKLLRTFAESENIRRRSEKQIEDSAKFAISSFAKSLVNVLDNLYRASSNIPDEDIYKNVREGIELTKKEFENVFEKFQIKKINPEIGSEFDHNFHQSVAHIPSDHYESGKIVDVLQLGYILNDRLLRPAMVAIAK